MAEPGAPGDPMVDAAVPERVGGLGDAGERGQEGDGVDGNGNGDDAATLARLEALAKSPYDRALHRANVDAARTVDEREEARRFMSQMITLEGQDWTAWIDDRKAAAAQASDPPALEASIEILELYKRACAEFLHPQLHHSYADYVVSLWYSARGLTRPILLEDGTSAEDGDAPSMDIDQVASGVFDDAFVREELEQAIGQTMRWHLRDGDKVWRILRDFEVDQLRRQRSPEAIELVKAMYLQRLAEPHLTLSDTHQLYSTFISTFAADQDYEANMVASQQIYNKTRKLVDQRERYEDGLASARFSSDAYKTYLAWELEVKRPNFHLVRNLFERALQAHASDVELWQSYSEFLLKSHIDSAVASSSSFVSASAEDVLNVSERMVKSCPASGDLAALAIRAMETCCDFTQASAFAEAQTTKALESDLHTGQVDGFVAAMMARADLLRHHHELEEIAAPSQDLVTLLQAAIAKIKDISGGTGDPHLRLEKYLVRHYERSSAQAEARTFFASLSKTYPTSVVVALARVDFEIKQDDIEAARKLFAAASKKRLDYPEYLFDAWVTLEHRDGTLDTLETALATVKREMNFVNARRQREAAKGAQQYAQTTANDTEPAAITETLSTSQPAQPAQSSEQPTSTGGIKRAASSEPQDAKAQNAEQAVNGNKRSKQEHTPAVEVKRDRENSTVMVSNLAPTTTENDLKKLFRDCGDIREMKLKTIGDLTVATVEFTSRDAVPTAQTRDKKTVDAWEVTVQPDWQSTLYVTNFPESFDAADIHHLFEKYGTIFETRWPTKRLKATRRFVYIQFVSPAAARDALVLHGSEIPAGSGQHMQVKLSDPTRKLTRTDADANKREIYVTGLHKFAKEADLRKLFEEYGTIKGARVVTDDQGHCRGFGFVDFDAEAAATASLAKNNVEYRKRRLAVVLADSRVANKPKPSESGQGRAADLASRSIHVRNLPAGVQEALLQQVFEKHGRIEAVNVHSGTNTAVVVFTDVADAAKLVLRVEPLEYDGQPLEISDESFPTPPKAGRSGGTFPGQPRSVRGGSSQRGAGAAGRAGRARGSRLGIGASRPVPRAPIVAAVGNSMNSNKPPPAEAGARSQADFKALLLGKQ